jgi:hypothetical protein
LDKRAPPCSDNGAVIGAANERPRLRPDSESRRMRERALIPIKAQKLRGLELAGSSDQKYVERAMTAGNRVQLREAFGLADHGGKVAGRHLQGSHPQILVEGRE